MGAADPNVVTAEGQPGAVFLVGYGAYSAGTEIRGMGTLHLDPRGLFGLLPGVLDASGAAAFALAPGVLPTGLALTFQAAVADGARPRASA